MKTSILSILAITVASTSAFAPSISNIRQTTISRNMFSGAGEATPKEDESGQLAEMEKIAKAMGMSLEEYQLGMNARMRMEKDIEELRVTAGDDLVKVERCGNSPPKHLIITVTDEGKALGKADLETKLLKCLKDASDEGKKGREKAQQNMMQFIGDQMKSMGGPQ